MSASLQINIATPCHENYQAMTPNEQGRFCGSCQKTVVDFSTMTDQEILDYISKASNSICGRLAPDQINKTLHATKPNKRRTLAYFWNLLLATLLMAEADAQVTPVKSKKPTVTKVPERILMGAIAIVPEVVKPNPSIKAKGVVIDSTSNEPIAGASIRINGSPRGTVADSLGKFSLPIDHPEEMQLELSAIGYKTETITVDKNTDWQHIEVYLKPWATAMDPVEVISYPGTSCRAVVGRMVYKVNVDTAEKIKRVVDSLTPAIIKKKGVKIFPNPIDRGNGIQLSLALKQTGEYKLELLNAAGQVMRVQVIQMPEKEKLITVPTEAGWSAGVYWVRITSQHVRNVYHGKVLIK